MDTDTRKIGAFLRTLRKGKGLTQEQLAEILLVSGRTVSRWETGTNMPDLSVLVQMADYYDVDIREIIDGERKGEIMDKELKETLSRVADYSEMEKEKTAKAGNTAFGLTFVICAVMIVIQLIMTSSLVNVIGETAILLIGGITYIGIMVYNGTWSTGSSVQSTPSKDILVSVVCSALFTVVLALCYSRMGAETDLIVQIAILFFVGITILGFVLLRVLAYFNFKRKDKEGIIAESSVADKAEPVNIFVADGNMQADMIIEALKQNDIAAYKQDTGDAGFASVRYGMGRGLNDSVMIFVSSEKATDALTIIKNIGLN
ncbi:helix-turn-helix domain-containing protein [Hespellia stercorisuis]|uniref:Transcriptional regulator, contains XRE-family HTH domain n=1 Tax=Hespellia stercorisuis DSM 15480 TaxID=1121950 RepID=A0A1M6M7I6_9FIRM|nr:helix-turn-helix domain-containing protein [Hespellia stercorisuis]SHJ79448.1 Transcriptional regulator, contains XRE-family HTH domain [Hespellia stercorisuis DSM 15480]